MAREKLCMNCARKCARYSSKKYCKPNCYDFIFCDVLKVISKNNKVSELIESSVENVLGKGYRTKDIMQSGKISYYFRYGISDK